ncbi:MAG TPA: hypothetical protein GX497_13765 [Bacillus bacterium]|nr:hypothetical protein [Bacillus sp. (in: firmicutes)]
MSRDSKGRFKKGVGFQNLIGQVFGRLTVLSKVEGYKKDRKSYWMCVCECGNEKVVRADSLKSQKTTSCGCYNVDSHKKHGQFNTSLYHKWEAMKSRCYNPNNIKYDIYGGRGIKVCNEWIESFNNFYEWSLLSEYEEHIQKYGRKNTTLDRINCDGNYEPNNCRWATIKEQNKNRNLNRKNSLTSTTIETEKAY